MVGIVAISALPALEMFPAGGGLVIVVQLPDKVIVVVAGHDKNTPIATKASSQISARKA
jgi:hypothetical protein